MGNRITLFLYGDWLIMYIIEMDLEKLQNHIIWKTFLLGTCEVEDFQPQERKDLASIDWPIKERKEGSKLG